METATKQSTPDKRQLRFLVVVLSILLFPIGWEIVRNLFPFRNNAYWQMTISGFALFLSGPLLILYAAFVSLTAKVKQKNTLVDAALLIGVPWLILLMYLMSKITAD